MKGPVEVRWYWRHWRLTYWRCTGCIALLFGWVVQIGPLHIRRWSA